MAEWRPSSKEEEYFARREFERKKKHEDEKHRKLDKLFRVFVR